MKPITITVPDDLDARAAAEARRRGISKSALIREGLDAVLPQPGGDSGDADPLRELAGFGPPGISVDEGEIDEVVYRG